MKYIDIFSRRALIALSLLSTLLATSLSYAVVGPDLWANSSLRNETAGTVSFTGADGVIPANAISGAGGDANLANYFNYEFFVTSDSAPLVVEGVILLNKGTLYQNAAGGDVGINTGLFQFVGSLEADTYFNLPGSTVSQSGPVRMTNADPSLPNWDATAPTLITGDPHINAKDLALTRQGMGFVLGKSEPPLGSAEDIGAVNFPYANITVIPDANGEVDGVFQGVMQTRRTAATHNGETRPLFSAFEFNFTNAVVNGFQDGVAGSAEDDSFHAIFGAGGSNQSQALVDASDNSQYPNGVTLFVPSNSAMFNAPGSGAGIVVGHLLVADDGTATTGPNADSGTLGWSLADLQNLASGGAQNLTTFANSIRVLDGNVTYGGAPVIESHETANGWVHIVDLVPVPEPDAAALLIVAIVGLAFFRRK